MSNYPSFKKSWKEWYQEVLDAALSRKTIDRLPLDEGKLVKGTHQECPSCNRKKLYSPDKARDKVSLACAHSACDFYCYDIVAAIAYFEGVKITALLRELSDEFGIDYVGKRQSSQAKAPRAKPAPKPREPVAGIDFDDPEAIVEIEAIKATLKNVAEDGPVAKYLASRGIFLDSLGDKVMRRIFQAEQTFERKNKKGESYTKTYPLMALPIMSSSGQVLGFHKTILTPDGRKAFGKNSKFFTKALRQNAITNQHGSIPLMDCVGGVIGFAEGVETSLSLIQAGFPVRCAMSAPFLLTQYIPKDARHVLIFGDLDKSGTGQKAANDFADKLHQQRPDVKVDIVLPPKHLWDESANPKGIDWHDVLVEHPHILAG